MQRVLPPKFHSLKYCILCNTEDLFFKLTEYEDKVAQAEAEKEQAQEKVYIYNMSKISFILDYILS